MHDPWMQLESLRSHEAKLRADLEAVTDAIAKAQAELGIEPCQNRANPNGCERQDGSAASDAEPVEVTRRMILT